MLQYFNGSIVPQLNTLKYWSINLFFSRTQREIPIIANHFKVLCAKHCINGLFSKFEIIEDSSVMFCVRIVDSCEVLVPGRVKNGSVHKDVLHDSRGVIMGQHAIHEVVVVLLNGDGL